jgi:hypothetical protein
MGEAHQMSLTRNAITNGNDVDRLVSAVLALREREVVMNVFFHFCSSWRILTCTSMSLLSSLYHQELTVRVHLIEKLSNSGLSKEVMSHGTLLRVMRCQTGLDVCMGVVVVQEM